MDNILTTIQGIFNSRTNKPRGVTVDIVDKRQSKPPVEKPLDFPEIRNRDGSIKSDDQILRDILGKDGFERDKAGARYKERAVSQAGVYRENINKVLGGTIGNKVADVLKGGADEIAKAGDAITSATSFVQQYLTRGAFGIIGIILIIGAVIILTKGKIR